MARLMHSSMADKLDLYSDVITRLASETVACSPGSWDRGLLSIQSDGFRLTYQLQNEGHADRASISETLRDLIDELYVRMDHAGEVWTGARLTWWREGEDTNFDIRFDYPEQNAATEPGTRRPWWKLGRW